jgi:hypothetical protein
VSPADQAVERQLEWEAGHRRLAIAGAVAAIVLQIAGEVLRQTVIADAPAPAPGEALERPAFLAAHTAPLIAGTVLQSAGLIAMIAPFDYLYRAVKARRPELPSLARATLYAGPILLGVGQVALQVVLAAQAADYVERGAQDYFAARRVGSAGAAIPLALAAEVGAVALIFTFVILPLNAMRTGLLTRFMGVLGIIVGILVFLPIGSPIPVLRWFWLGALAYLLSGRWPGGVPPAWRSGRAEPWPTGRPPREPPAPVEEPASAPARRRPRRKSRKRR